MTDRKARILTLFMSNGYSLTRWKSEGILSREILLYQTLCAQRAFDEVQVFSYDAADLDLVAQPDYRGIRILGPSKGSYRGVPAALWSLWGVVRHRRAIARSAWLKTNQVSGAWAAALSAVITRRPLMMRLGYILSRRFALNGQRLSAAIAGLLERFVFARAQVVVVTSLDAASAVQAVGVPKSKIHLAPTYVDVEAFSPKKDYQFSEPMLYVGRLEPQKNVLNLALACRQMGVGLDMVGRGSLEPDLRMIAASEGAPLRLLGQVANQDLPELLRDHSIFVLPSLHEGLPKVLIEAMAAGLVCVGTNIPGTVDLIEEGRTGYLIDGFSTDAIVAALTRALSERRHTLGAAARAQVLERFSLQVYVEREAALFI